MILAALLVSLWLNLILLYFLRSFRRDLQRAERLAAARDLFRGKVNL